MWMKLMETKNAYTAEMWKELFNAEALVVRVAPTLGGPDAAERVRHGISVPRGTLDVSQETWRKR